MSHTQKYLVYKHTSPSGKAYIGVTNDYTRRCRQHLNASKKGSELTFHRAIRKYGWSNFTHEILATDLTQQQAFDMEIALINIVEKGSLYNMTSGGDGTDSESQRFNKISNRHNSIKGYYYNTVQKSYYVQIKYMGKTMCLGSFKLENDAKARANYLFTLSDDELLVEYSKFKVGKTGKDGKDYYFDKRKNKYRVRLRIDGKLKSFGYYKTEQEAINIVKEVKQLNNII